MGWFKVHSDDLHKVAAEVKEDPKPVTQEEVRVSTRDVTVFIGSYRSEFGFASDSNCYGKVMTRTNARDAFMKAVDQLMAEERFNPTKSYAITVDKQVIKEPI